MSTSLSSWPGREHRTPSVSLPGWTIRRPLAEWLRAQGGRSAGLRVLDVGCGRKPYYPFFAEASTYVGVDVQENPYADIHGPIEQLPVEDGAFDVVLCTQVLEHVEDPQAAVRELHRVTAPGGRVLASTHGVMVYHPNPVDHWRWTHTGLERLFGTCEWARVEVRPGAGSGACLAFLAGTYLHLLAKRAHVAGAARPAIAAINRAGVALDRRVALLREPVPGALFANYHVEAVRG